MPVPRANISGGVTAGAGLMNTPVRCASYSWASTPANSRMPVGSVCPSTKTTSSPIESAIGVSSTAAAVALCFPFMLMPHCSARVTSVGSAPSKYLPHRNARSWTWSSWGGVFSEDDDRSAFADRSADCGGRPRCSRYGRAGRGQLRGDLPQLRSRPGPGAEGLDVVRDLPHLIGGQGIAGLGHRCAVDPVHRPEVDVACRACPLAAAQREVGWRGGRPT